MKRGILGRRGRHRAPQHFELQLTSMMDALVIIVVFLLKSYNVSTSNLNADAGLQLPISGSADTPTDSLQIVITPQSVSIDQDRIVDFQQTQGSLENKDATYTFKDSDLDEGGRRVVPLYDALVKAREKTEILLAKSKARENGKPIPYEGIIAVQADKKIKYETLRRVIYTAGAAGFKAVRFLAMKRDT